MFHTILALAVWVGLFTELILCQATSNYVIFGGTPAVVRTRIDPIINPGVVGVYNCTEMADLSCIQVGTHVHDVFGGSGFSVNYDYNQQIQSKCTSLEITQDFSNYWVVGRSFCTYSRFC
jgi:hypothetical protein